MNENPITSQDLIDYGFVCPKTQATDSQSETSTATNATKLGAQQFYVWINDKLGITLIPSGNGYLPKYNPPLIVTPLDKNQPPFSKHGKFILTLEDLKDLISHVKNKRYANKTNDDNSDS